jgi:hypothetical protein
LLFCRCCRALLPHLRSRHFGAFCLGCFESLPLPSGTVTCSLKWFCFGFCLTFDHLVEFFVRFFFLWIGEYVCCQCTHQGGDWGSERPRTGEWLLPSVMSDWQHGVDRVLAQYSRCRLRLDLHWCRWRAGAKGLSLVRPLRSGETSRLGLMDSVAKRDQVRTALWQKSKTKSFRMIRPSCRMIWW